MAGELEQQSGLIGARPFRSPTTAAPAPPFWGAASRPGEWALATAACSFWNSGNSAGMSSTNCGNRSSRARSDWGRAQQPLHYPCCIWWRPWPLPLRLVRRPRARLQLHGLRTPAPWGRLSGPLLDRIDLQVVMQQVPAESCGRATGKRPSHPGIDGLRRPAHPSGTRANGPAQSPANTN